MQITSFQSRGARSSLLLVPWVRVSCVHSSAGSCPPGTSKNARSSKEMQFPKQKAPNPALGDHVRQHGHPAGQMLRRGWKGLEAKSQAGMGAGAESQHVYQDSCHTQEEKCALLEKCALQTLDVEHHPHIPIPPVTIEGFLLVITGITYRVVVGRL